MPITIDEFVDNLAKSRLVSSKRIDQLRGFLQRQPLSAEDLARKLVQNGRLTRFQAAAIYQGQTEWLVLGDYIVTDKIGAGGMGYVFKAVRRGVDRVFALKVLPRQRIDDSPKALQRFLREIEVTARLFHPNIIRVHDAGYDNGVPYLVMEYVDGSDLFSLVRLAPVSVPDALDYILQAARGLAYAHGEGIIHRDIKPSNLLLHQSKTIKILDLGLARLDDQHPGAGEDDGRLTMEMQLLGTPNYMAPEQARDPRTVDARCDIYSLGCTWYYVLVGRPPYERDSKIDTLLAHAREPIPSIRAERADVPEPLEEVYRTMVAKNPDHRYASMNDVIAALEAI